MGEDELSNWLRIKLFGRKEEEIDLATGFDLLILVYFERVQLKNLQRRRIFKDQRVRVLFFKSLMEWFKQLLDLMILSHPNFLKSFYCDESYFFLGFFFLLWILSFIIIIIIIISIIIIVYYLYTLDASHFLSFLMQAFVYQKKLSK